MLFIAFDKYWYAVLNSARINLFIFHNLRHTTGGYLAMNRVSMSVIKET